MKKNHLLTLTVLLWSMTLHAQITQGRFTAGDHPQTDILEILGNGDTRAITFSPSVGYFLTNNFMIGGQFSAFNIQENKVIDFSQWSLSPYARYYLPGNLFLTAGLGVGNQRREIGGQGFEDRVTFYNLSVGVGKDFFIRGDVALEGLVLYRYTDYSGEFIADDENYNSLLIDFNLQPFVGGGLDMETTNALGMGSLLLDLQAQMQWLGQTGNDGFFTIDLAPRFGYFITDNLVVGGEVSVSVFGTENETEFGYGLSPLVRYYFPELSDGLYAFGALSAGFQKEPGEDYTSWSGHLGPGLDLFLTPNVALEGLLAYSFLKRGNARTLERALIRVGVQVFLRR